MSISNAISAYDASFFGSRSAPAKREGYGSDPDYQWSSRGGNCYLICLPTSGSSGGSGGEELGCVLVLAILAAGASAPIFGYFSVDSYKTAAEMGECRRSAYHDDPSTKNTIKKVFRYLEAERALTGTAHLAAACGLSLLIAACVFALMKRPPQPYLKFAIAGGAVTGAFVPLFGLSFLMNPRKEVEILRQVQARRDEELTQKVSLS